MISETLSRKREVPKRAPTNAHLSPLSSVSFRAWIDEHPVHILIGFREMPRLSID